MARAVNYRQLAMRRARQRAELAGRRKLLPCYLELGGIQLYRLRTGNEKNTSRFFFDRMPTDCTERLSPAFWEPTFSPRNPRWRMMPPKIFDLKPKAPHFPPKAKASSSYL